MPRLSDFGQQTEPNLAQQKQQFRLSDFSQTPEQRQKLAGEMTHPPLKVSRETRATKELPELGSGGLLAGEDPAKVAAIAPIILATTDPQEIVQIVTSTFPSIGAQQDEARNWLLGNNKTGVKVVVNKPDISKLDVLQGLGIITAFTPAGRAATIGTRGAEATAGMALRRGLQGGLAAAGTQAGIETAQKAVGGEVSPGEIAAAGGLGFAAEAGFPAVQALRGKRQAAKLGVAREEVQDIMPAIQEAERATQGLERVTGEKVGLLKAQKTLVPSQLGEQSFIGSLAPGAKQARKALLKQNEEIGKTVDSLLDTISSPRALERGEQRIRTIAQTRREALVALREEKTSPIYTKIFQDAQQAGVRVNVNPALREVEQQLASAPEGSKLQTTLNRVRRMLSEGGTRSGQFPERMQNTKFELDSMISGPAGNSLDGSIKRKLVAIKQQLVDEMENSVPGYKEANLRFEELSGPITRYDESVLGAVSRVTDRQLKTVSGKIFDPQQTNPLIVRQAKKVINDDDAWNQLLRVELEKRLGKIKGDLEQIARGQDETIENLPGQLHRAIFGNRKQTNVLKSALNPEQLSTFNYLDTVLERASLGRLGGSPTASREEYKKVLNRGVFSGILRFFGSPLKTITGIGEEAMFDRKVRALADMIYDPKWKPRINKIKRFRAESPDAARAMAQLLDDIESEQPFPQLKEQQ